jgi:hypothetical protein
MKLGFSIQTNYNDREAIAIIFTSHLLDLEFNVSEKPKPNTVPIGSVEYCCLTDKQFPVDFFPSCLSQYLNRKHLFSTGDLILDKPQYIKDLSFWKTDFVTKLYPKGTYVPYGNYMFSDPICFTNEWRYYVLEGEVITTGWYWGLDEDSIAPKISFPKEYTGAADFVVFNNKPELLESHAPFACGWYGEDHLDYTYWQYLSWNI